MPSVQQEITKKLARATILLRTPQVSETKVRSNWSATRKHKKDFTRKGALELCQLIISSISKVALFRDNI